MSKTEDSLDCLEDCELQVIPVIDLKNGQPVHAVGGQRDTYQPLRSQLVDPHLALTVRHLATAFAETLRIDTAYLADLDAIAGQDPAWDIFQQVIDAGLNLWIDCGCCKPATVDRFVQWAEEMDGDCKLMLPLECIDSQASLRTLINRAEDSDRLVFSLDLKSGAPIAGAGWHGDSATEIGRRAIDAGLNHLLMLDLSSVGTAQGPRDLALIKSLSEIVRPGRLATGGGVRNLSDLVELKRAGCAEALVASAIHSRAIGAAEIAAIAVRSAGTG